MCVHKPSGPPRPLIFRLHVDILHAIFGPMDKNTLSACSLVMRSWIDVARSHLFRRVAYHIAAEDDNTEHHTPPPLQDFLDFLDAKPQIGQCVRALSLTTLLPDDDPYDISGRRYRGAQLATLSSILRRTPGLRTLAVHHLVLAEPLFPTDIISSAVGTVLNHLDNLHVDLLGLPLETVHRDYLFRLFQLVGTVDKIQFDSYIFPFLTLKQARTAWPPHTLKHVRELHLKGCPALGHLSMVELDHLETFVLDEFTRLTLPWLNTFLPAKGPQLRHLTLPMDMSCLTDMVEPSLNISMCDMLESLTLISAVYSYSSGDISPTHAQVSADPACYAFMHRVLDSAADSVRSITLLLHNHTVQFNPQLLLWRPPTLMETDWSVLDLILERRVTRRGLREVEIRVEYGVHSETEATWLHAGIERVLPKTQATGALRFVDALGLAELEV